MFELRSGLVMCTDKVRGAMAVPGCAKGSQTRLPAHQRGLVSENRAGRWVGVAALQRALALGCCLLATASGVAPAGVFSDSAVFSTQPVEMTGPPDAAATLLAFSAVEFYIRGTSPAVETNGLPGVQGCSVVLRLAGEVIGRGLAMNPPGAAPSTACIAQAAEEAWREADRRLPASGTPEVRAAKIGELRKQLLISLELSGPLMQVTANAYADFDSTLQPGMDGLAATMEGQVGAVFPGQSVSTNTMPGECARRAVGRAAAMARGDAGGGSTVTLTEPPDLEKKHGVKLYRFRTTHVAQWREDKGPALLYRGQRLVALEDVDEIEELWYLADRLAGNLINRSEAAKDALPGTLSVVTGTNDPWQDPAFAASLDALALRVYCLRLKNAPPSAARAELVIRAGVQADRVARAAANELGAKPEGTGLATAAALVRYSTLSGASPLAEPWLAPSRDALNDAVDANGVLRDVPAGVRGVVAGSLGALTAPLPAGSPARDAKGGMSVRWVFAQTPPEKLATEMPWLGWAELDPDRPGQGGEVPSAPALREMRTLIWKHQLQSVDAGPDRQDMVGGIVVPGSSSPLPTWQTARLVAFLGTMLGEPSLTSKEERAGEMVRLLRTARFLRQLQVDDSLGWMCKDPVSVKGGLRNATWDQRTQTDATAMALMAVLEVIGGIEKASRQ